MEKAKYLKRKPLVVPNRVQLLQQIGKVLMSQMWFTAPAYEQAAVAGLLKEANQISRELS